MAPRGIRGTMLWRDAPARATARATRPISDRPGRGAPVSSAPGPAPSKLTPGMSTVFTFTAKPAATAKRIPAS